MWKSIKIVCIKAAEHKVEIHSLCQTETARNYEDTVASSGNTAGNVEMQKMPPGVVEGILSPLQDGVTDICLTPSYPEGVEDGSCFSSQLIWF